jgi:hypothetical protein
MAWADILSANWTRKARNERFRFSGHREEIEANSPRRSSEGPRRFWGDPKMPDLDYILLAVQLVRLVRVLLQLLMPKGRRKK